MSFDARAFRGSMVKHSGKEHLIKERKERRLVISTLSREENLKLCEHEPV